MALASTGWWEPAAEAGSPAAWVADHAPAAWTGAAAVVGAEDEKMSTGTAYGICTASHFCKVVV